MFPYPDLVSVYKAGTRHFSVRNSSPKEEAHRPYCRQAVIAFGGKSCINVSIRSSKTAMSATSRLCPQSLLSRRVRLACGPSHWSRTTTSEIAVVIQAKQNLSRACSDQCGNPDLSLALESNPLRIQSLVKEGRAMFLPFGGSFVAASWILTYLTLLALGTTDTPTSVIHARRKMPVVLEIVALEAGVVVPPLLAISIRPYSSLG